MGLALFTGVVKDKVFDIFSAFGITSSASTINSQIQHWAQKRDATVEIDHTKLLNISIDNVNFKRKYANTMFGGGHVDGRMLNLITSQVTHRTRELSNARDLPECKRNLKEEDFFLQPDSIEGQTWSSYITSIFYTATSRLHHFPTCTSTFLQELEKDLPDFTPSEPDNVVFTRVDELQASSVQDVSVFLNKLKIDLKIGTPGHPGRCIVCGDQQTYSIICNLVLKYPDTYEWIIPMPGDWHLLKLAAETLRDVLWDGGMHDLAKLCNHHKELNRWRDVHDVLLAIHECLMMELVAKWNQQGEEGQQPFEEFVDSLKDDCNSDEVSQFWAKNLDYLNAYLGYYFAIRSGNWNLRNACLPRLSELFFSYSHNKYEELVCRSMKDCMVGLPSEVLQSFMDGNWIVSAKGNKYHSFAMDEAHESMINKSLKEITTRPCFNRVVNLANFYAYHRTTF